MNWVKRLHILQVASAMLLVAHNALAVEPTCPANGATSPIQTDFTITLTWNPGCGSGRLVVINNGGAGGCSPSDGINPGFNNDYNLAPMMCSGWRAIYMGSGNMVTVTGLTSATSYNFKVYEYNEVPSIDYLIDNPAIAAVSTTGGGGPQATLAAGTVTPNSVQLILTPGGGQATMIAAQAGLTFTAVPMNGVKYCAQTLYPTGETLVGGAVAVGLHRHGICGAAVECMETLGSFTVSGLTPGSSYTFKAFEFDGCSTPVYNTATAGNVVTVTLPYAEPTTQSTDITFTSVTETSASVLWTPGNGGSRILVARQSAAVSFTPIDGVPYGPDSNFGTAGDVGSGNKVLYAGPGTTVAVTGLLPAITYHFQVFEANPATFTPQTNYLTTVATGNPTSRSTLFPEPTTQGSNLSASSVTSSSLTLTWSNGNGSTRIVVMDDSPITFAPTDGTTYLANPSYSLGTDLGAGQKCVYNGTETSVPITGLNPNIIYYFKVLEYNGSTLTANYLSSSVATNPAQFSTLAPQPTAAASGIVFSSPTETSLAINFTSGTGSQRLIKVRTNASPNVDPVDGTDYTPNSNFGSAQDIGSGNKIVYEGDGITPSLPVTVTGLAANTVYHVSVIEFNGAGVTANYLLTGGALNPTTRSTLALEAAAHPASFAAATATDTQINFSFSPASSIVNADGYIILRRVDGSPDGSGVTDALSPGSLSLPSGTTLVGAIASTATTTANSTGLNAGTKYNYAIIPFGFNGTDNNTYNYRTQATIRVASASTFFAEPTIAASEITFATPTETSLAISWTNGNGSKRIVKIRTNASSNVDPVDGADYTPDAQFTSGQDIGSGNRIVYEGTDNSVTVTGLTVNTLYHVSVMEFNGSGILTNYLTAGGAGNPVTRSTLDLEPSGHPASFTSSTVSTSQIDLTFSPAGTIANADGYIILVRGDETDPTAGGVVDGIAPGTLSLPAGTSLMTIIPSTATGSAASTGLGSGLRYNYAIIPYGVNGSDNDTYNYFTAASIRVTDALTIAVEPPDSPTALAFGAITNTSFDVSFTAATAVGYLVLRKAGASPTFTPVDGQVYALSSAQGDGKVVSVGASTSFSQAGLNPETVYHYDVFAFNGSGVNINYRSVPLEGSQTTLANEPANQPTAFSFTSVATTAFNVSFQAAAGSPSGYLVLRGTGTAPTGTPADGTVYTTGALLGDGAVAYSGSATSFPESGLAPGVAYFYSAFSFNGSGAATNCVTTAPLGGSTVTLTLAPVMNPASDITNSGFTASWGAVANTSNYSLDVSTVSDFSNFTGTGAINNMSVGGTSQAVTGLAPGTAHHYRVRSNNSAAAPSANSTPVSSVVTLPANPEALAPTPFSVEITTVKFLAKWNAVNGADNYLLDVTATDFPSLITGYNPLTVPGNATSSEVTGLVAGTNYKFRVRARNNISGESGNSNVISVTTVPGKPVIKLPTEQVTPISFLASWDPVPGATSYELDVYSSPDGFVTEVFATGFNAKVVIGTTEAFATGLTHSTEYRYRVRARNAGGLSENSELKSALTLTQTGGQANPPTVNVVEQTSATAAKGQISGGLSPWTVTYYHKKITEGTFVSEPPFQTQNVNIDIPIIPSQMDELGIEFYFKITDDAGREATSPTHGKVYVSFESSASPKLVEGSFTGKQATYKIIAVPYVLANDNIQTVFSSLGANYDKKSYRIGHYENGGVKEFGNGISTITRGYGYWFNAPGVVSLQVGAGSAPKNDSASPFKLTLSQGWNQIGNPYPFDIKWADVLLANPTVSGVDDFNVYNGGYSQGDGKIRAFTGAFVFSDGNVELSFPVSLRNQSPARTRDLSVPSDLNSPHWQVALTLKQGELINTTGGIGMSTMASNSKDPFDRMMLPHFNEYVEIVHNHPEFFYPHFTRDIVPTATEHTWDFKIESNVPEQESTITWDNHSFGDNDAQLFLLNISTAEFVDMREQNTHSFRSSGKVYFRIYFRKDSEKPVVPDVLALGDPYPNPFATEVSMSLILADREAPYHVEVAAFDLQGRKVRTVAAGNYQPGVHRISWDGLENTGGQAAHGIYILRTHVDGLNLPWRRVMLK